MVDARKYGFKDIDSEQKAQATPWEVDMPAYPKPLYRFHLITQSFNASLEEQYFWLLESLHRDWGLDQAKKIKDVFSASEQSGFWGAAQQRLSIQQQNVQNYLATIGKLIKDLFQLVRELRIIEERLGLYRATMKTMDGPISSRRKAIPEEIVLKGYWVDMKDGGVKSPGSVYGLASTLGYVTLPDLFFAAPVMKKEEVADYVDGLDFNPKVRDVLKKKLSSYLYWKEFTLKELESRYQFTLKYLRQHYNSIQLYISWVKPYLKNVKRLQMNMEKSVSEDLIGSFEGSFTEIETMFWRDIKGCSCKPVVVLTMEFRTQPHMDFHQDGYQHKGPVHVGRTELWLRGYSWTQKEMDNYLRMRNEETFDMLGDIDESLKESINALGDDMRNFLKEAGEKFPEDLKKEEEEKEAAAKKKKEMQMKGVLDPFLSIFSGFAEVFRTFVPKKDKKPAGEPTEWQLKGDKQRAAKDLTNRIWNTYKNFKKAHRIVTW
ncbi:TPA: hypothetical protein HA265_04840 [Candidatus Woesearchaeota archaeon]|nr:hypothetical protein [Candidatus Woesearchaeota archaeon]